MSGTAKDMIQAMTSWLGYSESNGKFKVETTVEIYGRAEW